MKTENQAAYQSRLPLVNWILPLSGILMAAFLVSHLFSTWDRIAFPWFFAASGPYLLLGLGCHISRQTAGARVLGFLFFIILLIVPPYVYITAYRTTCYVVVILQVMIFLMWICSGIAFLVLLGLWFFKKRRIRMA